MKIKLEAQVKWNERKTNEKFLQFISMIVESGAIAIWSDAKKNHKFRNRSGELEKSIRIEKIETGNPGVVRYEVKAGVGSSPGIRGNLAIGGGPSIGSSMGERGSRGGILSSNVGGVGAGGSDKAYYALYVELGTVKMPAYPYMRPALERNRMKILNSAKKIFAQFKNEKTY